MKKRYHIFFAMWKNEKPMAPKYYEVTPPDSYERIRSLSFKSYSAARRYRMRLERMNPNPPHFYRFRLARIAGFPPGEDGDA